MTSGAEIGDTGIRVESDKLYDDFFRARLVRFLGSKDLSHIKSLSRRNSLVFKGEEMEEATYRAELTRFLGFAGMQVEPSVEIKGQDPDFKWNRSAYITAATYFTTGNALGYSRRVLSPPLGALGMHSQEVRRERNRTRAGSLSRLAYSLPPVLVLSTGEADVLGSSHNEPLVWLNGVAESIVTGSAFFISGIHKTRAQVLENIISQFEPHTLSDQAAQEPFPSGLIE